MKSISVPKWQEELESFKGIKSTFIVEGNINDIYPVFNNSEGQLSLSAFVDLNNTIYNIFNPNGENNDFDFLFCNPISGFYNPISNINLVQQVKRYDKTGITSKTDNDELYGTVCKPETIESLSQTIKSAIVTYNRDIPKEERKPICIVMNFASRYISAPNRLEVDETNMFLNLMFASLNAVKSNRLSNTLILVVEKYNDLPPWFYYNNPNVRTITIPHPDKSVRSIYVDKNYKEFEDNEELKKVKEKFIDITDGLKILELRELYYLYKKNNINILDISDAVAIYKYGIKDNMWHTVNKKRIKEAEDIIKKRVMGQDNAVEKTVKIIKRAVTGLSGLQHSSGQNKPRGVLFFAGPTGTGKTELAKTLAELLFGDDKSCIRFDMSEYAEPHSDQKLFGAPPGYVGYEAGGQLTNAIKERPFSILLFDEIEKAHPSIMDKFLQILEDGRMTDGQGNTVYFSEAFIVFTSNLGISKKIIDSHGNEKRIQLVNADEPYEVIEAKILQATKDHFKPEVLNRLGNNIIIFDFIREEVSKHIAKSQIDKVNAMIKKQNKIHVDPSGAYEYYFEKSRESRVLEMGGRGIGNLIEDLYINPLAEFIFDNSCGEGSIIKVTSENNSIKFSFD